MVKAAANLGENLNKIYYNFHVGHEKRSTSDGGSASVSDLCATKFPLTRVYVYVGGKNHINILKPSYTSVCARLIDIIYAFS